MSLVDEFSKWKEEAISAPPPENLFDYTVAQKCLIDAERCLNAGYHEEFTEGIVKASQMLQRSIQKYFANHVELILAYATQTKEQPEEALLNFVALVNDMDQPQASGEVCDVSSDSHVWKSQ